MIELPKFDTFNKDEVFSTPQISSPEVVTISEIKQTYPQLGSTNVRDENGDIISSTPNRWNHAVQESKPDGTIVARSFYELEFDNNAIDFQFITDGDEIEFGSDKYWRVIHRFTETVYESDNSPEFQNFKTWQEVKNRWQQEIIYDHVEIDPIVWNRGKIPVNRISTTTTTGQTTTTTYSCPTGTPPAPSGETGESAAFAEGSGSNLACYRWESLPIPFTIIFDVGNSLGGFIQTDGTISSIKLKGTNIIDNSGENVLNGSINNPIKFTNRYIQISFNNPTRTAPTYVRLKRYGLETFRFQIPYELDQEPEFSHHGNNVQFEQRLFPPINKTWPDNFWNQGPQTPIVNFVDRFNNSSGGQINNG